MCHTIWDKASKHTKLTWSIPWERQMRNRDYLMELKTDNLLLHYDTFLRKKRKKVS